MTFRRKTKHPPVDGKRINPTYTNLTEVVHRQHVDRGAQHPHLGDSKTAKEIKHEGRRTTVDEKMRRPFAQDYRPNISTYGGATASLVTQNGL